MHYEYKVTNILENRVTEEVKKFLKSDEAQKFLNKNDLKGLYEYADGDDSPLHSKMSSISLLTKILYLCGIDIFDYNLTYVPASSFYLSSLTKITIPNNMSRIGECAFSNSRLKEVVIPGSVKSVGVCAFEYSSMLETIIVEEGVKELYNSCFNNISVDAEIYLPYSINYISKEGIINPFDRVVFKVHQDSYAEKACKNFGYKYDYIFT